MSRATNPILANLLGALLLCLGLCLSPVSRVHGQAAPPTAGANQQVGNQPVVSRIKDISQLQGAQENVLLGYGLVAGLAGTGDGRRGFTAQTLNNLIAGMGINVLQQEDITTEVVPDNVAAVMVMAVLPPFVRPGSKIDAHVISVGRAESLQGGSLVPTPLKGADGQFHGIAYGPLSIGGFRAEAGGGGAGGAAVQENHPVVGRIPNGVIVEGEPVIHQVVQEGNLLRWQLHNPDFKTASNMERKINSLVGSQVAYAEDASAVIVQIEPGPNGSVSLGDQEFESLVSAIAFIDEAMIETDKKAKIVINERTGTVVAGEDIRVNNVVIVSGPLRITIQNDPQVAQLGMGQGMQVNQPQVQAQQDGNQIAQIQGTTIGDVVGQLNALGYTPRDIISILQAMHAEGAIKAEIEII